MKETEKDNNVSLGGGGAEAEAAHEKRLWRRRRIGWWWCCGGTVAVVILIALICVILGVTVLKARNPEMSVNSVKLEKFDIKVDLLGVKVKLNVSLKVNASVKNRNKASFKFGDSTTQLYYRGTNVGEALIPAGKIEADKTATIDTTVNIEADRAISNSNLLGDVLAGVLPVSTRTRLAGRVNFLHIFKHHAVSSSVCNMSIRISKASIQDQHCSYSVHL